MKIAVFHELHAGGARRAVNEFAKRLKKNHPVDLYIINEKQNRDEKNSFDNVFFYKFVPKNWRGRNWKNKLFKDTVELFNLYRLHKKIAKEIDIKRYDFVFVHPSKFTQAPFILRFLKTRNVYYCEEALRIVYENNFKLDRSYPFYKRAYERIIRFTRQKIDRRNINSADLVLANSKNTQTRLKDAYGIESKVVYLGIDTEFFKPSNIKKKIDVLYIGAKHEVDGYDILKSAILKMNKKPTVKFHSMEEDCISDEELLSLYTKSKVVVCLAYNEPFGLVPLEAMACEAPVVAVDEGGYRETVVNEKTGYLVQRDPRIIAEKVEFLLLNESTRLKMGKNARFHVVESWTWEKSVNKLEKILNTDIKR